MPLTPIPSVIYLYASFGILLLLSCTWSLYFIYFSVHVCMLDIFLHFSNSYFITLSRVSTERDGVVRSNDDLSAIYRNLNKSICSRWNMGVQTSRSLTSKPPLLSWLFIVGGINELNKYWVKHVSRVGHGKNHEFRNVQLFFKCQFGFCTYYENDVSISLSIIAYFRNHFFFHSHVNRLF